MIYTLHVMMYNAVINVLVFIKLRKNTEEHGFFLGSKQLK